MKLDGRLRRFMVLVLGCLGGMLGASAVQAAEVLRMDVVHKNGRYGIQAEALVSVLPDQVQSGIVDVNKLNRLSSDILESRLLSRKSPNRFTVRMDLRSCVLVFCLERTLTETVITKDREVVFVLVPGRGSFRSGWVRWKLFPAGAGTRVVYTSELVPDFWVPPMIGPFLLTGKFQDNTIEVLENLEKQYAR
ncbi:MAG: SRPBCC family protein [Nitrospirae bacterium]|nr:SRPBCC family protein [Magnetococcales bacterium]